MKSAFLLIFLVFFTASTLAEQWYIFEDFDSNQCLAKWKPANINGSSQVIMVKQALSLKWQGDRDGVELKYFPATPIDITSWQKIRVYASIDTNNSDGKLNLWLHDGGKGSFVTGTNISQTNIEFNLEDAKKQIDAQAVREFALVVNGYPNDNGTISFSKIEVFSDNEITKATLTPLPSATISASSEQKEMTAAMAMDGKMDTRWSSSSNDNEWLQIDFNTPTELVGLKLHWETAYGRNYEIETLADNGKWETASKIQYGDGGVDEIYFGLRKTRAVRFVGHKRGTGWGYSLWEIEILGKENQILANASSSANGTDALAVLDGKADTYWQSGPDNGENTTLELTFPHKFGIGGLQINWAQQNSPACKIEALAEDSDQWQIIMNKKAGVNNTEDLFFSAVNTKKLRLVFEAEPVRISDIQIKGTSEAWTPVRHFEMLAQRLPDGMFPGWLRREQAFWTVTGLSGSFNESLLDEYGKVESGLRNFSVTPALIIDGKLLSAKNFKLTQSLADDWAPIPSVKWQGNDISLNITANTIEPDTTIVLYTLKNTSKKARDISLLLAARPLQINPPWQFGGYSSIKQANWQDNENTLILNDTQALRLYPKPSFQSLYSQKPTADSIDIIECLTDKKSDGNSVSSPEGIISAGARYNYHLAGGETKTILAIYPNTDKTNISVSGSYEEFFSSEMKKSLKYWRQLTGDWDINIPDKKLANLIRSNLAYLLINADGPATQPGSRNYNNSWIRDGAISATAMMRFGMLDFGKKYLQWFTGLIKDDGFIPFIVETKTGNPVGFADTWGEYDSFGEYAFLVREVTEITDDNSIAQMSWPKLKAAMKYMENLRNQRLTEQYKGTEYEGILPQSNSHEGYFPAKHSYWDDFFALKGLQDAQTIALRLGYKDDAVWLNGFEKELRKSLFESMEKVRQRDNLKTLPACAELGDFDPTSTSIGIMIADERDNLPEDALEATYDKYMQDCIQRAAQPADKRSSYTPYEVRNIGAMIRMGRSADARTLLDFFVNDGVRPAAWNHLAEVVHGDLRTPSYIGDMPHTWVGAELINSIRDMLVYEDRGRLVLAAAIPDKWLDKGISVRNLQTLWGPISYNIKRDTNGKVTLKLNYTKKPPNGFAVPAGTELIVQETKMIPQALKQKQQQTCGLSFNDQAFQRNGESYFILSGEMHYFRVDADLWPKHLQMIKEAGLNTVSSYVPWSLHEQIEGEPDFSGKYGANLNLERFIKLCKKLELNLILKPGPYILAELTMHGIPKWFFEKYPATLACDFNGRPYPVKYTCLVHPDYKRKVMQWYDAVMPLIAKNQNSNGGPVIMVQVCNEAGLFQWLGGSGDYSPESLMEYRKYLENHYTDIGELNKHYGSNYSTFEDVEAPAGRAVSRADHFAYRDWESFHRDFYAEYIGWLIKEIREHNVNVPLFHNVPGWVYGRAKSMPVCLSMYHKLSRLYPDILLGVDHIPENPSYRNFHDDRLINAFTKAIQGNRGPTYIAELQAGTREACVCVYPNEMELFYKACLANGAVAMNYYMFSQGQNPPGWGIYDSSFYLQTPLNVKGEPSENYPVTKNINEFINTHGQRLCESQNKALQALAFYPPYYYREFTSPLFTGENLDEFLLADCKLDTRMVTDELLFESLGKLIAMDNQEYDAVDITNADSQLDRYKQIWMACTEQMDENTQHLLLDYVRRGGHLICFPTLPKFDLNANPCSILADGLGINSEEVKTDSDGMIRWVKTNEDIHAISYIETFNAPHGEVIASTRNGKSCGIKVKCGKGSASILGTGFIYQATAHKKAWQHLSLDMNFKGPVTCDNPMIITRTRFNKTGGGYFFMLNYHNQTLEGKISFNNKKVNLPPFSGLIVPFDNP
ncbi:MAG: beta-galactosidase [Phycisphaerae bacterium]|jgi:beta-galactosidase GanA